MFEIEAPPPPSWHVSAPFPESRMVLPLQALAVSLLHQPRPQGQAAVGVELGRDGEPQLRPHHQLVLLVIEQHTPLLFLQPHPLEQPQLTNAKQRRLLIGCPYSRISTVQYITVQP